MINITCECHLFDINNELTDKYCCQTKVNKLQILSFTAFNKKS